MRFEDLRDQLTQTLAEPAGRLVEDVPLEMDRASLDLGLRDMTTNSSLQTLVVIGYHQLHPVEAAVHELSQELLTLCNSCFPQSCTPIKGSSASPYSGR